MHNFKELKVWHESRKLVSEVYVLTREFPSEEKFGLISQIRRAAVSIPTNIAEGCGRNTDKEFAQFLNVSLGSSFEVETLLYLSSDLQMADSGALDPLLERTKEIQRMIYGLIKSVRKDA